MKDGNAQQVVFEEKCQKNGVIQAWWTKFVKVFGIKGILRNNQKFCSNLITLSLKTSPERSQNCDGREAKTAAMQILLVRKCQVAKRYYGHVQNEKRRSLSRIPLVANNSSTIRRRLVPCLTLIVPRIVLRATSRTKMQN